VIIRLLPALTLGAFLLPIVVGLAGTLAPAFGVLPAIGAVEPSLAPWRTLLDWPGFATSLRLTLTVGALASCAALAAAVALVIVASRWRRYGRLQSLLTALLASPHAAIALGFAFIIAPSGWIVRIISPELTGWERPPTGLVTLRDPYGLALVAGLAIKEIPYLAIMLVSALGQVPVEALLQNARAMGYSRTTAWLKLVLPQAWPQIRLPFYAVVAYSFSVVDQALVLGPGTPPPLAVLATRWFSDYDVALYLPAAAAAILQLGVVAAAIFACFLVERLIARAGRSWAEGGGRSGAADPLVAVVAGLALVAGALGLASLAALVLWSVAGPWSFPDAWPVSLTLDAWRSSLGSIAAPLEATVIAAAVATAIALVLCIGCLENEARRARRPGLPTMWIIYVPLLVPQIAFLFGVQVALVRLDLDGSGAGVIWTHLIFVLPYVFLSLSDPWRALDPRYARSAASLGASPARILLTVKLPILLRPILVAAAIGVAVSVGLYLPTVFAGAGRISTVTTEALTLATGADRRIVSIHGFLQAAVPLLAYGAALLAPRLAFRHRRGLA